MPDYRETRTETDTNLGASSTSEVTPLGTQSQATSARSDSQSSTTAEHDVVTTEVQSANTQTTQSPLHIGLTFTCVIRFRSSEPGPVSAEGVSIDLGPDCS